MTPGAGVQVLADRTLYLYVTVHLLLISQGLGDPADPEQCGRPVLLRQKWVAGCMNGMWATWTEVREAGVMGDYTVRRLLYDMHYWTRSNNLTRVVMCFLSFVIV